MEGDFNPNFNPALADLFSNPFEIPTNDPSEVNQDEQHDLNQSQNGENTDLLSFSNIMNLNSFSTIQNLDYELEDEVEQFQFESQRAKEDAEDFAQRMIEEPLQDWELFQKELDKELNIYDKEVTPSQAQEVQKEPVTIEENQTVNEIVEKSTEPSSKKESIYTKPPDDMSFLSANTSSGQKLFIPVFPRDKKVKDPVQSADELEGEKQGYLTQNIYRIIQNIEDNNELFKSTESEGMTYSPTVDNSKLWVDRYNPKEFMDLTGDDRLNRMALSWLKLWDFCVFGKKVQVNPNPSKFKTNSKFKNNSQFVSWEDQMVSNKDDPLKRPNQKILMLCGPPGLGKTSLAKIIAKHSGYEPMEINASDDRTGNLVKDKIQSSIDTQGLKQDSLPRCIILDEIDGASHQGGNFNLIKLLVQLGSNKEVDASGKQSKKKKKGFEGINLTRPIICICNDQFAPVLRELRPNCLILNFKRATNSTLTNHLKNICQLEGVEVNRYTLSTLVDLCDGDIRNCLNNLQFLSDNPTRTIHAHMVTQGHLAVKNAQPSLFTIWDAIFNLPDWRTQRKESYQVTLDQSGNIVKSKRNLERLWYLMSSFGNLDKVMEGCFDHFLSSRYMDLYMTKIDSAYEWLGFYDTINTQINHHQKFELYDYLPSCGVQFHFLFASAVKLKMEFPKLERQFREIEFTHKNLLKGYLTNLPHNSKRNGLSVSGLIRDQLYYWWLILNPKSIEPQPNILSNDKSNPIEYLTNLMIDMNMVYRHIPADQNGLALYKLEPPIDDLVIYPSLPQNATGWVAATETIMLKPDIISKINHKLEAHRIKTSEQNQIVKKVSRKSTPFTQPTPIIQLSTQLNPIPLPNITNELSRSQKFKNFFKRKVPNTPSSQSSELLNSPNLDDIEPPFKKHLTSHPNIGKCDVWYKHQEKFTNAVKTKVTVNDFF